MVDSQMDEQQDAFGGQFFQIGVLYSWWCGIHIQILSITITDGEHTFMWNMKKGTWLYGPWYEARCSELSLKLKSM